MTAPPPHNRENRTETDIQECRKLWDQFSPEQDAWDDRDLMFAFHDQDRHRLNFLVHVMLHGNKMVALYAASNSDYNNLDKLLNVETVQEACRLRVDEISYMTGMQWKANWKMRSEPCLTMRKPPAPWSAQSD